MKRIIALNLIFFNLIFGQLKDEEIIITNLNINNLSNALYLPILKNEDLYLPLESFLEILKLPNQEQKNELIYRVNLGEEFSKLTLNFEKNTYDFGILEVKKMDTEKILIKENDIYIHEDLFKEIFLKTYNFDMENLELKVRTNFETPDEISAELLNNKYKLENASKLEEVIYSTTGELFGWGNARLEIEGEYLIDTENKENESQVGVRTEYVGPLLYGVFKTSYDFDESSLGDMTLYYPDIYNHSLEIGSFNGGKGLTFDRRRGYEKEGENYIITDQVPMGSTVELYYKGALIDSQVAENSEITFQNTEIKANNTYTLKIYTLDGNLLEKDIIISEDNNLQSEGELEYDISVFHMDESETLEYDGLIYYGLTSNFTMALGGTEKSRLIDEEYKSIRTGNSELIYSNNLGGNLYYTLNYAKEFGLTDEIDENQINFKEQKSDVISLEIDYGKYNLNGSHGNYGQMYDEKQIGEVSLTYDLTSDLEIGGFTAETEYYDQEEKKEYGLDLIYTKDLYGTLITFNYERNNFNENKYGLNLYNSMHPKFNFRLNSEKIEGDGLTLEAVISNKKMLNFESFDWEINASYSEEDKGVVGLAFSFKLDEWLEIFTGYGNKTVTSGIGIDYIFNVEAPLKPIYNVESSTVEIISFLDTKGDGIYKDGSKRIEGVMVEIGGRKVVTDHNGEATIYGITNDYKNNMEIDIEHPMYSMGNLDIKVESQGTSRIKAYLPVKPFITLEGNIIMDKSLKLLGIEEKEFFNNIIVKIKNESGEEIETTAPELDGTFFINGLFPKEYIIELEYFGKVYKSMQEKIELTYHEIDQGNRLEIVFK